MSRQVSNCSERRIVKTGCALFLVALLALVSIAPQATGAGPLASYVAFKGGIYSPSTSFNFDNLDVETTFDGDTRTGVNGEMAIGHYVLPTLAMELGLGYFKGKGSFAATSANTSPGEVSFDVIPLIVSAKALIPAGSVDPYGELGIGAYFTKFHVADNLNNFSGTSTFGLHAGAGVNAHISEKVFLGVEGRYVWANPSFGNQKIRLNDTEYALNGFKLNGFTTTLGVGFSF